VSDNQGVRRSRRAVAVLVIIVLLASLAIPAVIALRILMDTRIDDRQPSDVILVLGAAQYDGRPGPVLTARARHAAQLHRAGVAPQVATVGGRQPADRFTEAAAAAGWLVDHGIPASAVIRIPRGRDTATSMRAFAVAAERHGWQTVTIVTDPLHQFRSRLLAQAAGLAVRSSPSRDVSGSLPGAYFLGRETLAVMEYLVGRAGSPRPAAEPGGLSR